MKICKVEGCGNKVKAKELCCKHYEQIRRHGKIITCTQVTKEGKIIRFRG